MKTRIYRSPSTSWAVRAVLSGLAVALGSLMVVNAAFADEMMGMSGDRLAQIVKGGLMYDKWYKEAKASTPKGTHPAYPKGARYKGDATWRCKECHGWDYRGKDGAYKSGKHATGIPGIRGMAGGSEDKVVSILKDSNHQLGGKVSEDALKALAAFVVAGQVDMTRYISADKQVKGDAFKGGRIFAVTCARCHGFDGKEINFGSEKKPVYLGNVANDNPWETLHKIRMGQPDEEMLSTLFLSEEDQANILKFTMGLPTK